MKALTLILALFFLSLILHAQDQAKLLEHAYKTHSKKELKQFFDNWHKEIPPISDSEFAKLSDLQKETYKVFEAFYHPENFKILYEFEGGDSIYNESSFLILQNNAVIRQDNHICLTYQDSDSLAVHEINYYQKLQPNDTNWKKCLIRTKDGRLPEKAFGFPDFLGFYNDSSIYSKVTDSIEFRPSIRFGNKIPIYLTRKYEKILSNFLGNDIGERKLELLQNFVKFQSGNAGFWELISLPEAMSFSFDKTMTRAEIDFRLLYEGGITLLRKENGVWKIVCSKQTWIE